MLNLVSLVAGLYLCSQVCTTVHELGHFFVAKFYRFSIIRFKVGGGPKICSWFKGLTQFKFCWFPLCGGSVHVMSEQSEKLLKLKSYRDYRNRLDEDANLEQLLHEAEANKIDERPTGQLSLYVLGGPLLEFTFVLLGLWFFSVIPEEFRFYFVRGIALGLFGHAMISACQLLPFYFWNIGTDGFNFSLFGIVGICRRIGYSVTVENTKSVLKVISWVFWGIALSLIAAIQIYDYL